MTDWFRSIITRISDHVNRGFQIARIQIDRGEDPLNRYCLYTHYIAQQLIAENPQLSSEVALDNAIQYTNRRIDSYVFSDNLEYRNWARDIKQYRDDYRKINAATPDQLNKVNELILLENYNIELHDIIKIHQNASFDQKFKKIFGCSDFQKMCRNNQRIYRLRTDLNIN